MSGAVWAGYIRRSVKKDDDADISDDVQREVITRRVPPGAEIEWFIDSGGHNSGFTDQRPGYQRMLAALRQGRLAGITAYDDSRLNRNSENAMSLFRECASRAVLLRIDDSTMNVQQQYDDPSQKTMYGMRSLFSEQARAEMAKRNRKNARREFDSGGATGLIPFGYRGVLNEKSKPLRENAARVLEIVPEEAAVVVRLFEELAHSTLCEIAERFNVEGVPSPTSKGWSDGAVRAFWDRRWFYMGFVTLGHSGRKSARSLGLDMDRRPGIHPPILTEALFRDATAGVVGRRSGISKPKKAHRLYLLAGKAFCGECGSRLRGEPRISKAGRLYRYMACSVSDKRGVKPDADGNLLTCDQRRARAEEAEAAVLEALRAGVLPEASIEAAREELRERLRAPKPGLADQQRKRLETHLVQIRKRFDWGEMDDAEYLRDKEETEQAIDALGGTDNRLALFDRHRQIAVSVSEAIDKATPAQQREFIELLVERVVVRDRQVAEIEWVPAARPFMAATNDGGRARPAGLEPTTFRSAT